MLNRRNLLLGLGATVVYSSAAASIHGSQPSVKITAFGASNTTDTAANSNQSYVTQSLGLFKRTVSVANVAVGGVSANSTNNSGDFANFVQPSYDATRGINIVTLQFGGGNIGDLTSDPATVTPFYNNIVGVAQKWKALGANTKVIVFTTFAYGCTDSAMVTNYTNANSLILADSTHFDAVINASAASSVFTPSTSCPIASISGDCDHLTQAGELLLRDPYITANNLFL